MARQRRFFPILPFETHSVLLFAALTLGSAASHAQGGFSLGPGGAAPSTASGNVTPTSPLTGGSAAAAAFKRADANHDGQISRDEIAVLPALAQRFDAIDLDRNGSLSPAEFEQALKP